ncbi:uncharacterized protein LOC110882077 [Helianthus annuus]|uniref:uncharacterized protein LOC110882077 n=1 Tax=Helianthus annuus TaxID=4232 RepID=UPI000B8EFA41|nr:uncharacterized protein LOC110882077 [Helianthus annuus]
MVFPACSVASTVCMLDGLCVLRLGEASTTEVIFGPTIILEALASHDLWFWHAFFRVAGSNNDLNVIDQSPIFDDIIDGIEPTQSFYANGKHFKYGYYLVDGIYECSTLIQAFSSTTNGKRKYFTKKQESTRKYIERAFGVLKKRFHLIANPVRFMTPEKIKIMDVIYTYLILHNMILEDQSMSICQNY